MFCPKSISKNSIGWHVAARHDVNHTINFVNKAYKNQGCPDYVLFHQNAVLSTLLFPSVKDFINVMLFNYFLKNLSL